VLGFLTEMLEDRLMGAFVVGAAVLTVVEDLPFANPRYSILQDAGRQSLTAAMRRKRTRHQAMTEAVSPALAQGAQLAQTENRNVRASLFELLGTAVTIALGDRSTKAVLWKRDKLWVLPELHMQRGYGGPLSHRPAGIRFWSRSRSVAPDEAARLAPQDSAARL